MSHAGDNRTVDSIFHVTNFFLFDQTHKQVNSIYPCPYTASLDDVKTSQTSFKFSRTIIMIIYPPEWDNRRMGHSEPGSVHWMCVSGPRTTDTGEGSGNILQLISDYETLPLSLPVPEYPPHHLYDFVMRKSVACVRSAQWDNFNNFVSHGSLYGGNKVIGFFKHSLWFLIVLGLSWLNLHF